MKLLLLLMSGLEISDGLFTNFAVGNNLASEANSLMKSFVMNGDFIILKILGAVFCSLCLWMLYRRYPRIAVAVTSGVVVFYIAVISWNIGTLTFV